MPRAERLLRLYPRAWRQRYGEEFLATLGHGTLHPQQVIDIVSGAIDAWLSADVRRAATTGRIAASAEGSTMLKSMMICGQAKARYTTRDGLIGAGVMMGATLVLSMLAIAVKRGGWPVTGEVMLNVAFLGSLTLSMPFWLMKGQPWKSQVAIVGGTLALLVLITVLASAV